MLTLSNYNEIELKEMLSSLNIPNFKIKSINKWLLNGYNFDEMSNIDKGTREKLKTDFMDQSVKIKKDYISSDGTVKLLFELNDGELIEGVLMKYSYGNTLCISSQIGCRMGCVFCASGMDGLKRNLTPSEILGQVVQTNRYLGGSITKREITNIVMMGSGEPLDNYDNVMKFLQLINCENSLNISKRNISISTSGIVPKIKQMADENLGITLTISLHNPINSERAKIMPITKSYSVEEVVKSAKYYFNKTGRRVVFEYTLIKGENDNISYAMEIQKLLKGFPVHVNCIIYNEVVGKDLVPITRKEGYKFVQSLNDLGVSATLRRQMGVDIEGACGQLKRRYLNDEI